MRLFGYLGIIRVTSCFLISHRSYNEHMYSKVDAMRRDKGGKIFVGEPEIHEELGEILERIKEKLNDVISGPQPQLIPIPSEDYPEQASQTG